MKQIIYGCDHCGKKEINTTNDVRNVRVEYDMNMDSSGYGDAKFNTHHLCSRCAAVFVDTVSLFFAGVAC